MKRKVGLRLIAQRNWKKYNVKWLDERSNGSDKYNS